MLIQLHQNYLRIKKDSMPVDTLERLTRYLHEIWVTFTEGSNIIIIKGEPARIYQILYRLTGHFDIELM